MVGKDTEWIGIRRRDRRNVEHDACCFGINHLTNGHDHQLFMLGVGSEEECLEEFVSDEEIKPMHGEPVPKNEGQVLLKRRKPWYYDRRQ